MSDFQFSPLVAAIGPYGNQYGEHQTSAHVPVDFCQ